MRNPDSERYDLHPIVREYAYARLENKAGAHRQLCEYFQARPGPEQVETLADLAATIELYWHTVSAGRLDAACGLLRDRLIPDPLYFRFGAYQQMIKLLGALFPGGEDQPPRLASESAQGWALHSLGGTYNVSGQPRRAVPVLEAALSLAQKLGEKKNIPIGLVSLADCWLRLCELEAAEGALRRGIELSREVKDEFQEAVGHQELGPSARLRRPLRPERARAGDSARLVARPRPAPGRVRGLGVPRPGSNPPRRPQSRPGSRLAVPPPRRRHE